MTPREQAHILTNVMPDKTNRLSVVLGSITVLAVWARSLGVIPAQAGIPFSLGYKHNSVFTESPWLPLSWTKILFTIFSLAHFRSFWLQTAGRSLK